jgi:acyl carrier protein
MGHLESAAGIAGLIKAVLALNQGKIPANIHFETPNTFIDFDSFKLQVVDKPTPIAHTALAGVSSFGFGGANAHVIMAGAEESARKALSEIHPPFDRNRGIALQRYFSLDSSAEPGNPLPGGETQMNGVRELIRKTFAELTGVETIEADIALTDQGLDSLSATDFLSTLQKNLDIELDTDLLFDYPLFDSLALYLEGQSGIEVAKGSSGGNGGQAEMDTRIRALLQELTNLTEIDPDIELTDQGLDSLSATQLISQLETELGVELGADILFDYPLYDQFVAEVERRLHKEPA